MLAQSVILIQVSQEISFNTQLRFFSFDIRKTYKVNPKIEFQIKRTEY